MKTTYRQRFLLFNFVIGICLAVIAYAVFKSQHNLQNSTQQVERTQQIIYTAEHILSHAVDIETAGRGFILTADSEFLEPLQNARLIVFKDIETLRQLAADDASEQLLVDTVAIRMQQRLDYTDHLMKVKSELGLAAVIALIKNKEGKYITDHIRQIRDVIEQKENIELNERLQANAQSTAILKWFITGMGVLVTGVIVVLIIMSIQHRQQHQKDIAEKKQAEDDLKESEMQLLSIIENSADGIALINEQHEIIFRAPNSKILLGYEPEELTETIPLHLIHPDDHKLLLETFEKVIQDPANKYSFQYRFLHKNGNYKWFEGTYTNLLANENIKAIVFNYHDITDHKKAEEELVHSEVKFHTLYDTTSEAVMLLTDRGFFDCNPATLKMFGFATKEEFCAKHPAELSPPRQPDGSDSATLANRNIAAAMEKGSASFEWIHKRANTGETYAAEVLLNKMVLNGEPVLQATVRDITERKKAEENVRASEIRYRKLFDQANEGLIMLTMDGKIAEVNQSFAQMHGYTVDELKNTSIKDLDVLGEKAFESRADVMEGILAGEVVRFEVEHYHKDGHSFVLSDTASLINIDGQPFILAFHQDITERRKAELELLKLHKAVTSSSDIIFLTDLQGIFTYVNKAFTSIYGYTSEEVVGKLTPRILKSGLVDPNRHKEFWKKILNGEQLKGEYSNKRKNGTLVDIEGSAGTIYDDKRNKIGFVGVQRDITERKKVEMIIRESEENLKRGEVVAKFGHWRLTLDDQITRSSEGARKIYGTDKAILTSAEVRSFRVPEYSEMLDKAMRALVEENKPFNVEFKIKRGNDGAIVDIQSTAEYNPDTQTVFGVVRDITERKKAEMTVRESEENLKRGEIVAKFGHWKLALNEKITYLSPGVQKIYGTDNNIITVAKAKTFRLPEFNAILDKALNDLVEENKPFDQEYKIKRENDGKIVEVRTVAEYNAESRTVFGSVQDITERKKTERKIKATNDNLQLLLDSMAEGAYGVDTHGNCTFVNKSFLRLLGFDNADELVGKQIHPIIHHTYPDGKNYPTNECNMLKSRLTRQRVAVSDEVFWRKDGSAVPVEYWSYPIIRNGEVIGAVCTFIDITERKKAEEAISKMNSTLESRVHERTHELIEANTALEAFSYSVSHDLRAPVRSLVGFTKIITKEHGHELNADVKELFNYIESSGKRMNAIIEDLLNLAKYGKEKLHMGNVDMNKLFLKVWSNLLVTQPHKASLELETLPTVQADGSMLEQVIVNLLSNAIKYSSKHGKPVIKVGFEENPEGITFYVQDNGAGFDMQYYDQLFVAMRRLHPASEFEGTGVGLLLVKRIIEKHGGTVRAESKVGEGATFYFSLQHKNIYQYEPAT